jgi:hypothetical protein
MSLNAPVDSVGRALMRSASLTGPLNRALKLAESIVGILRVEAVEAEGSGFGGTAATLTAFSSIWLAVRPTCVDFLETM